MLDLGAFLEKDSRIASKKCLRVSVSIAHGDGLIGNTQDSHDGLQTPRYVDLICAARTAGVACGGDGRRAGAGNATGDSFSGETSAG